MTYVYELLIAINSRYKTDFSVCLHSMTIGKLDCNRPAPYIEDNIWIVEINNYTPITEPP